jgi:hypothetical protein
MTYAELLQAIEYMSDEQRQMEVIVRVSYDDSFMRLHPTRGPINISDGDDYDESTGNDLLIGQPLLVI